MSDRYLRIVLTVIALELAWIGVKDLIPTRLDAQTQSTAARGQAQAQPAATRVVIAGVDLPQRTQFLPVAIAGSVRGVSMPPWSSLDVLRVEPGDRPLRVELPGPVNARIVQPIQVDTTSPLNVKSVQATGAERPGL